MQLITVGVQSVSGVQLILCIVTGGYLGAKLPPGCYLTVSDSTTVLTAAADSTSSLVIKLNEFHNCSLTLEVTCSINLSVLFMLAHPVVTVL